MKKNLMVLLLLFLFCLPAIKSLFGSGYFPMHDDTQVARVIVMGRALRNGEFPVRWVSDLGYGYGYPIYNFYGPLPYYVGGFLYMVGVPAIMATKAMMIIGFLGAALTMFLAVSYFSDTLSGLVTSLIYVYAPYHAVQLFVRGAIGEMWVLMFLPLILLGNYLSLKKGRKSLGILIGGIGISGTILSHTILGFTTVFFYGIFIVAYAAFLYIKKERKKSLLASLTILLLGLGISAFFWIPAITEMKYTSVSQQIGPSANVLDHFVCPSQFVYSQWGYGGSTAGCEDGLSFMVGRVHLLIILLGILSLIVIKRHRLNWFLGGIGLVIIASSMFLMTAFSSLLWKILPGFSYVQYPWRFFVYLMAGVTLIALPIFENISVRWGKIIISFIVIILLLYVNTKFFTPQFTYQKADSFFESDQDIRFRVSKISDEYLPPGLIKPKNVKEIIEQIIPDDSLYTTKTITDKEMIKKIEFNSEKPTSVILNHADFPGWKYWVNSQPQAHKLDHGRQIIQIPQGFSTLEMEFTDTIPRIIGNVISLISMILLGYYYGKKTFR